jgi:enediyne biosynthesis protein E4
MTDTRNAPGRADDVPATGPTPAAAGPPRRTVNRRVALAWKWAIWSLAATGAAVAVAMWVARADRKPVDPGSRDVAGLTDDLARKLPPDVPRLRFVDVAPRLGLPSQFRGVRTHQLPEDMGGGVAVADFDGDGRPDVLLVGSGALPEGGPSYLLRNEPPADGAPFALRDVTKESGLPGALPGMGATVADVDADGRLDVLLTYFGGVKLLHNEGAMRFADWTERAGLAVADGWCTGASFGDADGDGDLDLYVGRYVAYERAEGRPDLAMYGMKVPYTLNPSSFRPATNLFFRNRGDGTFEGGESLAKELGIDDPRGRSLSTVFGDFDLDGLPDLYVANDVSDNAMFQGAVLPDGTRGFKDVSCPSNTADYRGAMGLAVADGDNDGDDEIFITHWLAQENAYYRNLAVDTRTGGRRMLFMDEADRFGLGAVALDFVGWATDFADFDLDGRLDLFAANGSTIEDQRDRALLQKQRTLTFWSGGESRGWFETAAVWGDDLMRPRSLRGGAAADLDGDGDLDLVLGAIDGPPEVLLCEGAPRHRPLAVELRASAPNTFGIGARVTVACGGREQSREMRSSPGYISGGPPVLTFGLGDADGAATVRVHWPDGSTSEHTVPASERRVVVRKP